MLTRSLLPIVLTALRPTLVIDATAPLWQTTAGTTAAVADGDPVGLAADLSGFGRHGSQATSTKRPTLKLAVQNGLPVLRFDGVDDFLSGTNCPLRAGAVPYTIAAVVAFRSAANAAIWSQGTVLATNRSIGLQYLNSGTVRFRSFWYGTDLDSATARTANVFDTVVTTYDGSGTRRTYLNGVPNASDAPTALNLDAGLWAIGTQSFGLTSDPAPIDLGELRVYPRGMSDGQVLGLSAALKARWGTP